MIPMGSMLKREWEEIKEEKKEKENEMMEI